MTGNGDDLAGSAASLKRPAHWAAGLPWSLFAIVVVGLVARNNGLSDQYLVWSLLLLMPVLVFLGLPVIPAGRLGRGLGVVCAAWLIYQLGATIFWARLPDLAEGRLAQDILATTIFLTVAALPGSPQAMAKALVSVSALTLIVILTASWIGPFATSAVFGHRNFAIAVCLPPLVGWWCWLVIGQLPAWARGPSELGQTLKGRRRWLLAEPIAALLVLGVVVFGWLLYDPEGPRRGGLLGIAAGGAAAGWTILHARRPTWAWSMARIGSAILLLVIVILVFSGPMADPRSERLLLYKGALATAWEGLPWGWGAYGSAVGPFIDGGWARECTAIGLWSLHSHNEFLEAIIQYGIAGAALAAAFLGLLVAVALRIPDVRLRIAGMAALAAFAVQAATHNAFGQLLPQLWGAILLGLIARCGCGPARPTEGNVQPWLTRAVLAGPACWCLWVAWGELPMMAKHVDASIEQRLVAIRTSHNPFALIHELQTTIADALDRDPLAPVVDELLTLHRRKLGGAGSFSPDQRRTYLLRKERLAAQLAAEVANPLEERDASRLQSLNAALHANDLLGLESALAMVRQTPFWSQGYIWADEILRRRPDLAQALLPSQQTMIWEWVAWFAGRADAPRPQPEDWVEPIDRGAEALAQANWLVQNGARPERMSRMLEALSGRYANIPDVALFITRAAIAYEGKALPWLESHLLHLRVGMIRFPADEMATLVFAHVTPTQAPTAWRFLAAIYPELTAALDQGVPAEEVRGFGQKLPEEAGRIWDLLAPKTLLPSL